jgi:hypothetical protein
VGINSKPKKPVDLQSTAPMIGLNMSRKPKIIELDPSDLIYKSVKEIDTQLEGVWSYVAMALGIRQHKAFAEKITAPPPAPPSFLRATADAPHMADRINQPNRAPNSLSKPPRERTWVEGSGSHIAYTIIDRYPRGVDLPIFREEFEKLYTKDASDAAHNKAVHTLKATRHVVPYKKKLFTYGRLKQFLADVAAGVADDIPDDQPILRGKWGIAVYEFIRSRNGAWVEFGEIVDHVLRQPGFETATNAPSLISVALTGLRERHRTIEKHKEGQKSRYRLIMDLNETHADVATSATAH